MPNIADPERRIEEIKVRLFNGFSLDDLDDLWLSQEREEVRDLLRICKERGLEIERLKKELEMFKRIKEPSEGEIHNQEHKP